MNDELPPGIRAQLIKIKRLAETGLEGERDNAARLLSKLCEKHGVSPETLVSDEKRRCHFTATSAREFELFKQCYFYVCRKKTIEYWKPRKGVDVELTAAEQIDLRACYEHYREAYRKAEEEFYTAFLAKHSIYGPASDEPNDVPLDPEKLARLLAMIKGMQKNQWTRPAAALNA